MSSLDYSLCDFSGVDIRRVSFGNKSYLPEDYNLFKKVLYMSLYGVVLPDKIKENIHLYNFTNVEISNFSFSGISVESKYIINNFLK